MIRRLCFVIALGAATLSAGAALADTLWRHNGSVVRLIARGNDRLFVYDAAYGNKAARAGDLLFEGRRSGGNYSGFAYVFTRGCKPLPYRVDGYVANGDTRVILIGARPQRDRSCRLTGQTSRDVLVFDYLRRD